MTTPTPHTQKLYRQVAAAITEAIAAGHYGPGQRLPAERELVEQFGVSRPTLREAVLALEIRGLVEARKGSGVYVLDVPPDSSDSPELDVGAFELTEARALFEGEAAALAAATITDEELARLEEVLADMARETAEAGGGEQADRRFHVAVAQATCNAAIVSVVEILWDARHRSPLCRHMLDRARAMQVRPSLDEHRRVLAALKARDPLAARRAMREHLQRVIEGLLAATELEAVERARTEVAAKRDEYARRRAI